MQLGKQLRKLRDVENLAVVVTMPGAIHVGALALDYLSDYENVLCIGNGLTDAECAALRACKFIAFIRTPSVFPHSEIIDQLIENIRRPFWLVDHDCYVLKLEVLHEERKKLPKDRAGMAFYNSVNPKNGVIAPETFLMLVNPGVLRALRKKYDVTTQVYEWKALSRLVQERLRESGISPERRPEEHKPFFDTFRVLALLAQADGCGFVMDRGYDARCQIYPEMIHIGGTSELQWPTKSRYYALGSYFWRRCLETSRLALSGDDYGKKWSHVPGAGLMREHPDFVKCLRPGDSPEMLDYLDALVARSLPR